MNKTLLLSIFLSFSFLLSAQVTNEGVPESWNWTEKKTLTPIKLPSFDLKALQDEDANFDHQIDRPWRFGKEFEVNYGLNNSGEWSELENGDRVWRIRFHSKGAITLNFLLEDFHIPRGAKIYLYNNDQSALLGAYDASQNNEDKVLSTWLVEGDDVWVEYFEPHQVAGEGNFTIKKVVHGYRTQNLFANEKGLNSSGPCNHDVDCPIDQEIEELKNHLKKGVTILLVGNSGFCSGSLINNATNDKKPYVLTARHCGFDTPYWAFRFNWISPNPVCAAYQNSTNGSTTQTISGAQSRANRQQSDFHLVEINNPIPESWDVVWNGWDNTDAIPTKTFGIHHPSGDIMKVCVDRDAPGKFNTSGQPVWRIYDWELGVTEGGSSGSPLFDVNGRIIGQLWRGSAMCSGTVPVGYDEYGRFAASWDAGYNNSSQLKPWLDPDNSNITRLNPYPELNLNIANEPTIASLVSVYPNPAYETAALKNNSSNELTFEIFDITGKSVKQGRVAPNDNQILNLSTLKANVYFVKIKDISNNSSITKKLIVK